jgi:hypothetical protein
VGLTIELDYELCAKTDEIAYVLADGVLPPKFEAG